jgi:hypothetical protein
METERCKYPDVDVQLSREDGNVFSIIGRVSEALRRAEVPPEEIKEFQNETMSGDYDHAIQTCMKWVNVA